MTNRQWMCNQCPSLWKEEELLTAPNPFDATDTLTGCPNCKQVTDGFTLVCDEPGCNRASTCGWPCEVTNTYRNTCTEHWKR